MFYHWSVYLILIKWDYSVWLLFCHKESSLNFILNVYIISSWCEINWVLTLPLVIKISRNFWLWFALSYLIFHNTEQTSSVLRTQMFIRQKLYYHTLVKFHGQPLSRGEYLVNLISPGSLSINRYTSKSFGPSLF